MRLVRVGAELLRLARDADARAIFVVGTGRDVGKTTVLIAVYRALRERGLRTGLASIGREGDAADRQSPRKPPIWLDPGTVFVTARGVVAPAPAVELLEITDLASSAGALIVGRVAAGGFYRLAGPPTASGAREIAGRLTACSEFVVVDGAVDRVSALAGSQAAVVVSCGAAAAATMDEAVDDAAALVARLRVARFDSHKAAIELHGALTAAQAARLIAARETRQIVVRDPTQIALHGRAGSRALAQLDVRCRRPLRVVALAVASIGPQRCFEPQAFAAALARATDLPVFDVYAGSRAA